MIWFHRVLISTAIVFCAGFALWTGWRYLESPETGTLVLSVASFLATAALSYYLRNLKRFLGL